MTNSAQTLSDADRRVVAEWAAACAEWALWLFESERPGDDPESRMIASRSSQTPGRAVTQQPDAAYPRTGSSCLKIG